MIISDGGRPSNVDRGYILRRLIRRMIRHAKKLNINIESNWEKELALIIINQYKEYYKEIEKNKDVILEVISSEKIKFNRTLEKGLKEFEKVVQKVEEIQIKNTIGCGDSFNAGFLYEYLSSKSLEKSLEMGTFAASRNAENIAPGCIL